MALAALGRSRITRWRRISTGKNTEAARSAEIRRSSALESQRGDHQSRSEVHGSHFWRLVIGQAALFVVVKVAVHSSDLEDEEEKKKVSEKEREFSLSFQGPPSAVIEAIVSCPGGFFGGLDLLTPAVEKGVLHSAMLFNFASVDEDLRDALEEDNEVDEEYLLSLDDQDDVDSYARIFEIICQSVAINPIVRENFLSFPMHAELLARSFSNIQAYPLGFIRGVSHLFSDQEFNGRISRSAKTIIFNALCLETQRLIHQLLVPTVRKKLISSDVDPSDSSGKRVIVLSLGADNSRRIHSEHVLLVLLEIMSNMIKHDPTGNFARVWGTEQIHLLCSLEQILDQGSNDEGEESKPLAAFECMTKSGKDAATETLDLFIELIHSEKLSWSTRHMLRKLVQNAIEKNPWKFPDEELAFFISRNSSAPILSTDNFFQRKLIGALSIPLPDFVDSTFLTKEMSLVKQGLIYGGLFGIIKGKANLTTFLRNGAWVGGITFVLNTLYRKYNDIFLNGSIDWAVYPLITSLLFSVTSPLGIEARFIPRLFSPNVFSLESGMFQKIREFFQWDFSIQTKSSSDSEDDPGPETELN